MAASPRRWTSIVRVIFGLALLVALVYYVDLRLVLSLLVDMQPAWLLATAATLVAATLLGAVNLFLLVGRGSGLRLRDFLPLYWTSWAIGLVMPGQIGDMASITSLLHRRGHQWQQVLSRSLVDKLISFSVLLLFALGPLARVVSPAVLTGILLGLVALAAVGLWAFAKSRGWAMRRGGRVERVYGVLDSLLRQVWECGVHMPGRVTLNVLLTVVKTVLIGLSYAFTFRALGYSELSLVDLVPLVAASSLVAYVPVSFNGVGTAEAAGLVLFGALHIAASAILAAYLLLRVTVMVLAWVPAAGWLLLGAQKPAGRALRESER